MGVPRWQKGKQLVLEVSRKALLALRTRTGKGQASRETGSSLEGTGVGHPEAVLPAGGRTGRKQILTAAAVRGEVEKCATGDPCQRRDDGQGETWLRQVGGPSWSQNCIQARSCCRGCFRTAALPGMPCGFLANHCM